jgi:hypothetical protein
VILQSLIFGLTNYVGRILSSISFEYGEVVFKMISLSIPNASLKQKLSLQCNVDDDICIE